MKDLNRIRMAQVIAGELAVMQGFYEKGLMEYEKWAKICEFHGLPKPEKISSE